MPGLPCSSLAEADLTLYFDNVTGSASVHAEMRSEPTLEAEAPATIVPLKDTPLDPAQPEFWVSRLVHRKYSDLAKPSWPRQFSARIEYQGVGFYFPLGSDDRLRAARRARGIYETVITYGWPPLSHGFAGKSLYPFFGADTRSPAHIRRCTPSREGCQKPGPPAAERRRTGNACC